jgi:hypothetical protein
VATLSSGGILFIPKGTFTGYLDIPYSNITIYGIGNSSVLKLPDGANRSIIKGKSVSNVHIFNLSFDGNADNNTVTETSDTGENNKNDAIYLSKGDNYNIHHCYFKNTRGNAINLYSVTGVKIESNHIDTCNRIDQNGITVQFASSSGGNGGVVSNNFIKNNPGGMGMSMFTSHEMSVIGNTVLDCSVAYGFEWGSSKWAFSSNKAIRCNKGAVITLRTDTNAKVSRGVANGNVFADCVGSSSGVVQLSGLRNVVFSDNVINGGSSDGLYMADMVDCSFANNHIYGVTGNGIYLLSTSTSKQVDFTANRIHDCGTGTTGNGMYIATGSELTFQNNEIYNNKEQGLKIQNVTNLVLKNNTLYDNQATHTQQYGIWFSGCSSVYNLNNITFGNQYSPQIKDGGSNTNVGNKWVTTSTGYGKYTHAGNNASTAFIPHGLGSTPTWVQAQAGDANAGSLGIKNVTADGTNITVVFNSPTAVGTNYVLYWRTEV